MRSELEVNQARALTLHDIADQMPLADRSPGTNQAKVQLALLAERIKIALKTCLSHMSHIETKLHIQHQATVRPGLDSYLGHCYNI